MSEVDTKVKVAEQALQQENSTDIKAAESSTSSVVENAEVAKAVKVKAEEKVSPQIKKTRAIQHDDKEKNIKYDASSLPNSEDPSLIRGQVEFYFSDSNLLVDKHMKEQIQAEENRPVKISHIHNFKRMKRFQPYSAVVAALRDSVCLNVTGPEGEETVQRKQPFDYEKAMQDQERIGRSVYVKGFGDEEATTQFDVETFFVNYGSTRQVRLRRTELSLFKGSAFAEFDDVETAQKFLNADPKPIYKDCPDLIIKSRAQYEKEKLEAITNGDLNPGESRYNNRNNYPKRGGRGGFRGDKDDWNKRRDHDRKNGFRDNGGRGGRGRGDRGRGRGRGGRDDRQNNRNGDNRPPQIRDTTNDNVMTETEVEAVKKDTETKTAESTVEAEPSKKRAREEDIEEKTDTPAAKKEKLAEETKAE